MSESDLKNTARQKAPRGTMPDRLPPSSRESEQGILGCIMLSPPDALPQCIEKLKEGPEVLYDLRHQVIYGTMLELYEDGIPIDLITLQERLRMWDKLEQVGGLQYISTLPDAAPSAANVTAYVEIVREKWLQRRMIQACTNAVQRLYEHEGENDELLDQIETELLQINESRVLPSTLNITSLVHQSMQEIEAAISNHNTVSGLATGFIDFDRKTDGMHPGEMLVVAARPSIGKSSLASNIVDHVAVELGLPVGEISLEMTGKELVKRMIGARAQVNIKNLRTGFVAARDMPKLTAASGAILHAPIHIDDQGGQSIMQIRAKARRWKQQHGIVLLVIDYLQLANAEGGRRKFENRQQEVTQISCGIKNLAKELGIPIIVLSQLNRDVEREKNRKPRLSDLRESGAIEQDADVVTFLYRARSSDDDDESEHAATVPINWLIAKQRNGETGDVRLTFRRSYTRFENAASAEEAVTEATYEEPQQQPGLAYEEQT